MIPGRDAIAEGLQFYLRFCIISPAEYEQVPLHLRKAVNV